MSNRVLSMEEINALQTRQFEASWNEEIFVQNWNRVFAGLSQRELSILFDGLKSREAQLSSVETIFLRELRKQIPAVVRGEANYVRARPGAELRRLRSRRMAPKKEILLENQSQ